MKEGLVSVVASKAGQQENTVAAPILVEPGIIARYEQAATAPILTQVDPALVGRWSGGNLVFTSSLLRDVVAEINRLFSKMPLVINSQTLEELTFSGALTVSTPERMATQLAKFLSIDVQILDDKILLSAKK